MNTEQTQGQNIIKVIVKEENNGNGTAGFVLSLISLVLCWIPVISWILCIIGFILSFVGIFKKPKGLAIAGLIISVICLLIFYALFMVITDGLGHSF